MNHCPSLILASASPRRQQLLNQIGVAHRVWVSEVDETPLSNEDAACYVLRVAAAKAQAAQHACTDPLPVLAADTAVIIDQTILGKPNDAAHARAMLQRLSGRAHQVLTGLVLRQGDQSWHAVSTTTVHFRDLSEAEIDAYWHSGEPCDKAGAYAIQGLGAVFIRQIEGSFSGVMGLPLFETAQLLREVGIAQWPARRES